MTLQNEEKLHRPKRRINNFINKGEHNLLIFSRHKFLFYLFAEAGVGEVVAYIVRNISLTFSTMLANHTCICVGAFFLFTKLM